MKITNQEIYNNAVQLMDFTKTATSYIPAKVNFAIQKNIKLMQTAAQEIEEARLKIAQHFGEPSEDGNQYSIPADKQEEAKKELFELFQVEQELDIKTFKIEDLGEVTLTPAQMQALMFMIEEE